MHVAHTWQVTPLFVVPYTRLDGWAPTQWADFLLMKRAAAHRPSVVLQARTWLIEPDGPT